MGNNCTSCFDKSHDNNIQDLSKKNHLPFFVKKNPQLENQDENVTNLDLKNDSYIYDNNYDKNDNNNIKSTKIGNNIPIEYITKLNKLIKGFLFRKSYKKHIKNDLEKFSIELYNKYIEKTKKEMIENILNNNIKNEKLTKYQNTSWKDYYKQNPNEDIEKEILKTKKHKGIKIKYKQKPSSNDINELLSKIYSLYEGEINLYNGKKCGFGKEIYKDSSILIGTFYNDKSIGWNKLIESNGTITIGLFKENNLNGKGIKYSYKTEYYYEGDFVKGLKEGKGIEINNGNKYKGSFEKDKKCGYGKLIFESGDIYEGRFLNNKFDGEGHYYYKKNGNEYIGEYSNGLFNGEGMYKWNENEYYKGQYKNGIKEGKGEIRKENGDKYICPFVNGVPHGIGIYENIKGKRKEVEFINGKINKHYKSKSN